MNPSVLTTLIHKIHISFLPSVCLVVFSDRRSRGRMRANWWLANAVRPPPLSTTFWSSSPSSSFRLTSPYIFFWHRSLILFLRFSPSLPPWDDQKYREMRQGRRTSSRFFIMYFSVSASIFNFYLFLFLCVFFISRVTCTPSSWFSSS